MMKPPRMHLISEIPDPAAYGANARTRNAAEKEKKAWKGVSATRRLESLMLMAR